MARGTLQLVPVAAGRGCGPPPPGLPKHWPACLQRAGLLPSRLSEGLDRALVDTFLYTLYGMYVVVLAVRMNTCSR